jgi:hypothetical protein
MRALRSSGLGFELRCQHRNSNALKLQSSSNARATKFAAVAAFFQGLQFIKTVPPFWSN